MEAVISGIPSKGGRHAERERERPRDESVDLAKGIGILFVIGGHCGYTPVLGIQPYSFHMPLFYFIAGFFLHFSEPPMVFLGKKVKLLLLPYFIYNVFFGVVTYLLQYIKIPWGHLSFFDVLNFHNLFIEPFFSGHQYQISCPLWFVPSLFLVMLFFSITRNIISFFYETKLRRTLLVFLLVILYYINIYGYNYDENMYMAVLSRTLVGYSFCILGNIFYKYYRNINTLTVFIGGVFLYGYLSMKVGVYGYSTLFNQYGNGDGKIISFFLTLAGVLMVTMFSRMLVHKNIFFNKEGFIWLGKNSFHIMAIHLSAFLILNICIAAFFPDKHVADITNIYFRYPNIDWIYFFFSTWFCIAVIKKVQFIKNYWGELLQKRGCHSSS